MFAHYILVYALRYTDFPVYTQQRLTRGQKSVCFVQPVLDATSQDSSVSTVPTLRTGPAGVRILVQRNAFLFS